MDQSEQRILEAVRILRTVLNDMNSHHSVKEPGSTIFTYGDGWTLVFATGDRAQETLEGVRDLYGVEIDTGSNSVS